MSELHDCDHMCIHARELSDALDAALREKAAALGLVEGQALVIKQLEAAATRPLSMQEIRLHAGEGALSPSTILSAARIVISERLRMIPNFDRRGK
jgi:hypothetical protein